MGEIELQRHGYNHMIVWLDQNIASKDEYHNVRKVFTTTTNPESTLQTSITDLDITNLICDEITQRDDRFLDVPFPFMLFDKASQCLTCLRENAGKKRIFFITSSQLGKDIVKRILEEYPEIFQDNQGKFYDDSIYVFCGDAKYATGWAIVYLDQICIQVENDDQKFLARLTRDIAKYLVSQGQQELSNDNVSAAQLALQYFTWAKQLYVQADKVRYAYRSDDPKNPLNVVIQFIIDTEQKIKQFQSSNIQEGTEN